MPADTSSSLQHLPSSSNAQPQKSQSSSSPNQRFSTQQQDDVKPSPTRSAFVTTRLSFVTRHYRQSLLLTAIVFIKDGFGLFQPVRALLDSCSEVDLITQETVDRLLLPKIRHDNEISGVESMQRRLKYEVTATVKSGVSDYEWTSNYLVMKTISIQQPAKRINIVDWSLPDGIELADPRFHLPQRIDLLIGSNYFFDILLDGKICLGDGFPRIKLVNTKLGWIVGGKIDSHQELIESSSKNI